MPHNWLDYREYGPTQISYSLEGITRSVFNGSLPENIKTDGTFYELQESFKWNDVEYRKGDFLQFYDNATKHILHRQ